MLIAPSVVGFVAGGIGGAIVTVLRCDPVAGQWDLERYHPTCWDPKFVVDLYMPWAGTFQALNPCPSSSFRGRRKEHIS